MYLGQLTNQRLPQKWRNFDWSRLDVIVTDGHRQPPGQVSLQLVNINIKYENMTTYKLSNAELGEFLLRKRVIMLLYIEENQILNFSE